MARVSTREKLLSLIDDIELISREVAENVIASKPRRMSQQDHNEIVELLVYKDKELKKAMALAAEQGEIEKKIDLLKDEVKKQDDSVKQLQKNLKDAETVLATAIYQAKQKLESIKKSNKVPVPSEELIKYGHRISASNAVAAPLNWQQGDPRRPYPTDTEMRLGFLGQPATAAGGLGAGAITVPGRGQSTADFHVGLPSSSSAIGAHGSPTKIHGGPIGPTTHVAGAVAGQFSWQGGEIMMTSKDGSHLPIDTNKGPEDVEVMSTDSSSSSSTDSN